MCGIAGFWTPGMGVEQAEQTLVRMQESLRHRGPDDAGIWFDAASGVGFGQRRLAILDLSPLGHQPMVSASGRYTINFNGEIFNYQAIQAELGQLGHGFRGHSDTEVMLAAFEQWGVAASVKRFVGMFAMALWDAQQQTLHLIRDRLGIKPLYYGWQGNSLLFASELKACKQHPDFVGALDRGALGLYFQHNYVPAPWTIYRDLFKQQPGTILSFGAAGGSQPLTTTYWSLQRAAEAGLRDPFRGSDAEAVDLLESTLREAVQLRMIADVPLGAFLSGGVDSSTVVALMQAQSPLPVRTFTIGFDDQTYNEADQARAVAAHLGASHTELIVTPQAALDVVPRLPHMFDEPFGDSSQIPTFLVSQMTRRHVTVSLSGDGGDELFGGYARYARTQALWRLLRRTPMALRRGAASAIQNAPAGLLDQGFGWLRPLYTRYGRDGAPADKLRKAAELFDASDARTLYRRSFAYWKDVTTQAPAASAQVATPPALPDLMHWMMYLDTVTYLPDDILVKVDRASMAVGLEARVPLLDHRVVELAWRLPLDMKVRAGQGKWILRQLLKRHVPPALTERPKRGFAVPVGDWLREPLKGWASDLLDAARLQQEGYINGELVREKWQAHQQGSDWSPYLWGVLMFQAWLEAERSPNRLAASAALESAPSALLSPSR